MANGFILYSLYFLNGISFLCFCDEIEKFYLTGWKLALLATFDLFFSVIFAIKAKELKKFWVLAAGLFFGFNLVIWAVAESNLLFSLFQRSFNLLFFTGFSVLAPCFLLNQQHHRVEMIAGMLQSFFILGCATALIFYTYCTSNLSIIYLILSIFYLLSSIKLKKHNEILKISDTPSYSSILLLKKPKYFIEFLIQLFTSFSLMFIYKKVNYDDLYLYSIHPHGYLILLVSYFLASAFQQIISKCFKHECRAICFGIFLTSLAYCLYSDLTFDYLPSFFRYFPNHKIFSLSLLGIGNTLMFIPTFPRLFKVAKVLYSLEINQNFIYQFCINSWIFLSIGRVLGYFYSEFMLGFYFGNYIDVLVVGVIFDVLMIFYAFLTDAFNLFSEDLMSNLNEIEIIDLGELGRSDEVGS